MSERKVVDIPLRGGLDLTSPKVELYQQPGAATKLINFENGLYGGYRRINGYSVLSLVFNAFSAGVHIDDTAVTSNQIDDLLMFAGGIATVQDGNVFWTSPAIAGAGYTDWFEISCIPAASPVVNDNSRQGADILLGSKGDHSVRLVGFPNSWNAIDPSANPDHYGMLIATSATGYPVAMELYLDGLSQISFSGMTFGTTELPIGVGNPTSYKERLVVSKDSTVFWSTRYKPADFFGASAGQVDVGDQIVGLKSFRERLFIFCDNSIHVLDNIDGAPILNPVTRNIGCVSNETIQEVGGDLIFLATDGMRSLGATDRIGDISLGLLSRKITPLIPEILNVYNSGGLLNSVILNTKNQFRLFYTDTAGAASDQKGICGTLSQTAGGLEWAWSEIHSIAPTCITANVIVGKDFALPLTYEPIKAGTELIIHGDASGLIFVHDYGNTFGGTAISAEFRTPEINFGSSEVRKTLHALSLGIRPEDQVNMLLSTEFDNGSPYVHNPPNIPVDPVYLPMILGEFVLGESVIGASDSPFPRTLMEGGGYSCRFTITTDDTNGPYSIDSMTVEYVAEQKYR